MSGPSSDAVGDGDAVRDESDETIKEAVKAILHSNQLAQRSKAVRRAAQIVRADITRDREPPADS